MVFSMILAAIGAGVSYVGQQRAAAAAEAAGAAQQKAAAQAAHNLELQNQEAINRERVNKRRRLARLRADQGTSGVVMSGSSMDVFAETSGNMELGIQDSARAGAMEAYNLRTQGDMALWQGRTQAVASRIGSYGTLLTDASRMSETASTL